jgi:L-lactate dehydrogenase complex protein LldE
MQVRRATQETNVVTSASDPKKPIEEMRIGLFIPCYIDTVYPEVGRATLELLERFGLNVDYPLNQTCCGQPMSNSGDEVNAAAAKRLFVQNFKAYDCIVGPAGSCVKEVRCHFDAIEQTDDVKRVSQRTYELVEFLHDIVKVDAFPWAEFPPRYTIAAVLYVASGSRNHPRLWPCRSTRQRLYFPR